MFRVGKKDCIKAFAISGTTGKILSSVYDSGFTKVSEIQSELLRKIPYFGGNKINIQITNIDKEKHKSFDISPHRTFYK